MPHQIIVGSAIDVPILKFLWLWKAATTATLGLKFYGNPKSEACYKRLRRLAKAGFIRPRADDKGLHHVWVLEKKGFFCIKAHFEPDEDGFKSENLCHDLFVQGVHLGDWVHGLPQDCHIFTEQQLRRHSPDRYSPWLPQTDRHRPDGYWVVKSGDQYRTIALEVELSRKPTCAYETIAEFYEAWKKVYRVVWVVPRVSMAKNMVEKFRKVASDDVSYHNILLLQDVMKKGWQAEFFLGKESGQNLRQLLGHSLSTSSHPMTGEMLLNCAKTPHKSKSYKVLTRSDFCY